ncbi:MAG: hypothetical protein MUF40_05110 [Gemmatimonadaceae bacterium]|jgi:hypothetical protein|nr:hypothetical protein [Gemmatimonadaceae bacterium]
MPTLARTLAPAVSFVALATTAQGQLVVRDSSGAPVPHAIVEGADGRRLITDGAGAAPGARRSDGPWTARRIGYRPGTDDDGDGVIVLARAALQLPTRYVVGEGMCTVDAVASRSPAPTLDAVRSVFLESAARRAIVATTTTRVGYRVETVLISERGDTLDGGTEVETFPVRGREDVFVPGRVIERQGGRYVFVRPGLHDIAAPAFLDAHCLTVTTSDDGARAVIRFTPIDGARGSHVVGTFVVDRTTGRLIADTVRYLGAPRGAPQGSVDAGDYSARDDDALAWTVPQSLRQRFEPHDVVVRLPSGERVRVVRIEQRYARAPEADVR